MRTRLAPGTFNIIYWPIETIVRELDGSLLLSAVAAQRGWTAIIGGKTELYSRLKQNAEPGIVIDKSIQKGSEHYFRELKKAGHRVFARCEEGLTFATPEDYCNRKTGKAAFSEAEGMLAWGRAHANALDKVYPQFSEKVVPTGNVRFDLLTPALRGMYARDVARLKDKWGSFYLLNTKFAKTNYIKRGPGFVEGHIAKGHAPNEKQVRLVTAGVAREKALMPHFVEFIERFAKELPNEVLIIRPHPGEDFSLWKGLAAGKANVHVVHEGSVHPWLLASKMSISNDCTTSIEAFLMDKPGINFRPIKDDEVEWELPKIAAYQVESTDTMLSALASSDPRSVLSLPSASAAEIVGHYVAQSGGKLASEAILDYFAPLQGPRSADAQRRDSPLGRLNPVFVALRSIKILVAWCVSADNRARHRNRANKFAGISSDQIAARLNLICETLGYDGIRVKELAPNIFQVDRSR